jgi:hypothetical protein
MNTEGLKKIGLRFGFFTPEEDLRGVFSEAAIASLKLPRCIDRSRGWGCGVYREVIPNNLSNFMQLPEGHNSGLEITVVTDIDEKICRAWIRTQSGNSKLTFLVNAYGDLTGNTKRVILGAKNIEGQISRFRVEPGSEELEIYNSILNMVDKTSEMSNNGKLSCRNCHSKVG